MLSKQCDAFARITNLSIITRRGDDHEGDGWSLLGHAARMTVRTCTVCPTSRTRLFGPWRYLANAVCPPTGVPLTAYIPAESLHACRQRRSILPLTPTLPPSLHSFLSPSLPLSPPHPSPPPSLTHSPVFRASAVTEELQNIADEQGTNVEKLVALVKENQEILDMMKVSYMFL